MTEVNGHARTQEINTHTHTHTHTLYLKFGLKYCSCVSRPKLFLRDTREPKGLVALAQATRIQKRTFYTFIAERRKEGTGEEGRKAVRVPRNLLDN